jgi:biopolymer transport protein TolR
MAIDIGSSKGGVRSDINVVPMVDIMLVLLVIFMLVAPMLQKGVDVRLPEAAAGVDKPETQGQTVLAITADRRFYVNGILTSDAEMLQRIQAALEEKRERIVLIKGDTDAPYGAIMNVMDRLREAQIEDIGLITEPKLRPGAEIGGN